MEVRDDGIRGSPAPATRRLPAPPRPVRLRRPGLPPGSSVNWFTGTPGGRIGRQLGTVFATTVAVGALLGGTVSSLIARDGDTAHRVADRPPTAADPPRDIQHYADDPPPDGAAADSAMAPDTAMSRTRIPVMAGVPVASVGTPPPPAPPAPATTRSTQAGAPHHEPSPPPASGSVPPTSVPPTSPPHPHPSEPTTPPATVTPTPPPTPSPSPRPSSPPKAT
jgi:hypothetical protein